MTTDPNILIGRILQKIIEQGYCEMEGYNKYTYLARSKSELTIGREKGKDTPLQFINIYIAAY